MKIRKLVLACALYGMGLNLWAADEYAPPVNGTFVTPRSCHLETIDEKGDSINAICSDSLKIGYVYRDEQAQLTLSYGSNTDQFVITEGWCGMYSLSSADTIDLNNDQQDDVMLASWCGGNGLAVLNVTVIFLISGSTHYEASVFQTMDPTSIIRLKDGSYQFIHREAVLHVLAGADKKEHSFWVYHFLGFDGQTVKVLPEEPVWIMYTDRANHTPTTLLNSEQKNKLRGGKSIGISTFSPRLKPPSL